MICVDADEVPSEILQRARSLCFELLDSCKANDTFTDFPYKLDGGWPDIDPNDGCVTYAQIRVGMFALTCAAARGSSKEKRERGAALGLVLAAAADPENAVDLCDRNPDIVEMAECAKRKRRALLSSAKVETKACVAVKCEAVAARPSATERIDQLEAVVARLTERIDKLEAQPRQRLPNQLDF